MRYQAALRPEAPGFTRARPQAQAARTPGSAVVPALAVIVGGLFVRLVFTGLIRARLFTRFVIARFVCARFVCARLAVFAFRRRIGLGRGLRLISHVIAEQGVAHDVAGAKCQARPNGPH